MAKKKITVCHLSSSHGQEDNRIFKKECVSLAEAGYKVYLVTTGNNQIKDGVCFVGAGKIPNSRLERMISFTRKVYKQALLLDADIYHIHDPELLPYALKLQKKGKQVIFDSHEFMAINIAQGNRPYIPKTCQNFVSDVYMKYERHVTDKIAAVIVPSKLNGQDYFNGHYNDIAYVNNAPRLEKYISQPNQEKFPRSLGYVGSITPNRGIFNMIYAAASSNCTLHLVGPMSKDLYENLSDMPEWRHVKYYGELPVEKFVPILSRVQIGLCLLKKRGEYAYMDNLSTKVYEYMALGLPVVVTDFPNNKAIIEKKNCGICVDPENKNGVLRAISTILDSEEVANKMGENGKKVANEFSWKNEEKNLLDLYKRVSSHLKVD